MRLFAVGSMCCSLLHHLHSLKKIDAVPKTRCSIYLTQALTRFAGKPQAALCRVQTQILDGWLTRFILRSGLVAEAQALLKDAGKYRFSPSHCWNHLWIQHGGSLCTDFLGLSPVMHSCSGFAQDWPQRVLRVTARWQPTPYRVDVFTLGESHFTRERAMLRNKLLALSGVQPV